MCLVCCGTCNSLVCCSTRKRIHNIDNCGIWFVCLVCCGTRKRIHNAESRLCSVLRFRRPQPGELPFFLTDVQQ